MFTATPVRADAGKTEVAIDCEGNVLNANAGVAVCSRTVAAGVPDV